MLLSTASCGGDSEGERAVRATTSTTASTTVAPVVKTSPAATELCARAVATPDPPVVASVELREISGVAASRQHPGLLWAHNDSGSAAELHLVGPDGSDLGAWPFLRTLALDWEDIALGPGPGGAEHLYVGDIGDNLTFRPVVRVHRVREPADTGSPVPLEVDTFVFSYPDGPHDAESLFVDPIGGQIHVATKAADGSAPGLYRSPASAAPGDTIELERAGALAVPGPAGGPGGEQSVPIATAASISPDGTVVAVRTLDDVLLWDRDPSESVADALTRPPCVAPSADEKQGEAVDLLPDGTGYVTISEGTNPAINHFVIAD